MLQRGGGHGEPGTALLFMIKAPLATNEARNRRSHTRYVEVVVKRGRFRKKWEYPFGS